MAAAAMLAARRHARRDGGVVSAWHDPKVSSGRASFRVFMAVYVSAVLVIVGICLWSLWGEVLAAWPK